MPTLVTKGKPRGLRWHWSRALTWLSCWMNQLWAHQQLDFMLYKMVKHSCGWYCFIEEKLSPAKNTMCRKHPLAERIPRLRAGPLLSPCKTLITALHLWDAPPTSDVFLRPRPLPLVPSPETFFTKSLPICSYSSLKSHLGHCFCKNISTRSYLHPSVAECLSCILCLILSEPVDIAHHTEWLSSLPRLSALEGRDHIYPIHKFTMLSTGIIYCVWHIYWKMNEIISSMKEKRSTYETNKNINKSIIQDDKYLITCIIRAQEH